MPAAPGLRTLFRLLHRWREARPAAPRRRAVPRLLPPASKGRETSVPELPPPVDHSLRFPFELDTHLVAGLETQVFVQGAALGAGVQDHIVNPVAFTPVQRGFYKQSRKAAAPKCRLGVDVENVAAPRARAQH